MVLRPKSAAVLDCLLSRAGSVVSKRELLDRVWPEGFIGDAVLSVCVAELRRALGDDPRRPRFIATVHGRGYRLVAEASATGPGNPDAREDPALARSRCFVGRGPELATLNEWWTQAGEGGSRAGFIAAQAGVGKTALVDAFASGLAARRRVLVGRGECAELFGAGEPYLPVLDALAGLCTGPEGDQVREVLRRCAPTWLRQLPRLLAEAGTATAWERTAGVSGERTLREFADAMEVLAAGRGLVLVLEDLHDSDRATTGLISYLARRRGPGRFLLLGTYRPAELAARAHPLRGVTQDLRSRGQCGYLPLEPLPAADTGAYLAARLAPLVPSPALAADVHARTEGNALFMVAVTESLLADGLLAEQDGTVSATDQLGDLGIPDDVRPMLERQIDALSEADRRMLAVAAAAGVDFTAEALAAGLGGLDGPGEVTAATVEDSCGRLARSRAVLVAAGESHWPDGTVSARYRFTHAMYREVCYEQLGGPAVRARVHGAIGGRLAAAYGAHAAEVAGKLATHCERGGDYQGAAAHLCTAAVTALERSAYPEARDHAWRALELLGRVPDQGQRTRLELQARRVQVVASAACWAWRDPQSAANCERLRELATEMADGGALATALFGLHNHATASGDVAAQEACLEQVARLARRNDSAVVALVDHFLRMQSDNRRGRCAAAWGHAKTMLALYDPVEHGGLAPLVGDQLDVAAHLNAATALWQLGYPDQARRHVARGVSGARAQEIPAGLARALWFAGVIHVLCGDAGQAGRVANELEEVCARHGLPLWRAGAAIFAGWAAAAVDPAAGLARLRQGMAEWTESAVTITFHQRLAAELCLATGDAAGGLAVVRAGLDTVARTGQGQGETELLRLEAELLLVNGTTVHAAEAEELLRRAVALAERRQARSFQLRAATSLARLWQSQGRTTQARELLSLVYGWFTEGRGTRDLVRARTLLTRLDTVASPPEASAAT